jgi:hypothetical protein
MPSYNKSKTQSKNGGRRKKQTKRKLRRGRKSRKVMGGGGKDITYDELLNQLIKDNAVQIFLDRYSSRYTDGKFQVNGKFLVFDAFCQDYNTRFNTGDAKTLYQYNTDDLIQRLGLNDEQVQKDPTLIKLEKAIRTLAV